MENESGKKNSVGQRMIWGKVLAEQLRHIGSVKHFIPRLAHFAQ